MSDLPPPPPPYGSQHDPSRGQQGEPPGQPSAGSPVPPPVPPQTGQQYPPAPTPGYQQPPPSGFPPPPGPSEPDNSGKAIASMVTGIVSLFVCYWFLMLPAGIAAVILGIVALKETGPGGRRGRGMAITGIITGGVALVVVLFWLITMALGWTNSFVEFSTL